MELFNRQPDWDGLTLEEIRCHRAMVLARITVTRELLRINAVNLYRGKMPGAGRRGLFGRVMSALNVMDYVFIGVRIVSTLGSLLRVFRR